MGIEKQVLRFPRGSDIKWALEFVDDESLPLDMTGWELEVFEAGPAGAAAAFVNANSTFEWSDQVGGVAEFFLDWDVAMPETFWVRLRITRTSDGHDDALDEITVRFT